MQQNYMKKTMTLCIIKDKDKILLGLKKKGFGEGRWNGFGGKVKDGESIKDAAIRELNEEAGIKPLDINKKGKLIFEFIDGDVFEVHVFSATKFKGEIRESDEMKPQWFDVDNIPFDKMWPDDKHWFPLFLKDKIFEGRFLFKDENTIVRHELREFEM